MGADPDIIKLLQQDAEATGHQFSDAAKMFKDCMIQEAFERGKLEAEVVKLKAQLDHMRGLIPRLSQISDMLMDVRTRIIETGTDMKAVLK